MERERRERWERFFVAVLPEAMRDFVQYREETMRAVLSPKVAETRIEHAMLGAVHEARLFADAALAESDRLMVEEGDPTLVPDMTESARDVLEEMRGGSICDVSPERSERIIADALAAAYARGVGRR